MLRIRVKNMGPSTRANKEWKCCFGLHVRTATIIIGIWHLFLNVLALGVLAIIIRTNNKALLNDFDRGYDDFSDQDVQPLPTPLSKIDPPYAYRDHSLNYHDVDMGGLVCLCMIAITLMMIYGAVKGKPSHLLPFFCLQLFDFAITTLTAAGYLCYIRSVHRLIAESHRLPWRDELLKLSPQTLSIVVLISFILVVFLKAYAIGIVWRCYKFLTMRQHNLRSMLPYIIPDATNIRQERDYSSLLPDYDEAIAQAMKQAPPPSYQVAMSTTAVVTNPAPSSSSATTEVVAEATTATNITTNETDYPTPSTSTTDITQPPPYNTVATTSPKLTVNINNNENEVDQREQTDINAGNNQQQPATTSPINLNKNIN
uniref:Putative lysosomal-associated transmembrane protein n=1 Tax=Corethrella appendiculata TaxID=1370023 RepID=U5EXK5_9DIPT